MKATGGESFTFEVVGGTSLIEENGDE
jgi:hypothetical protein